MRILIADDESIIRMGLRSMLESMGHEVVMARDGREALAQGRKYRLDLAILDIKMPLTDGLQTARALARGRPLPIIMLTAFSQTDLVEQATDLPIHGYLIKPVRQETLAAAIAVAVKRFREMDELAETTSQLEAKLAARKLVDRAKAKLMSQGLTEAEAYQQLQATARESRKSLGDIAAALLNE